MPTLELIAENQWLRGIVREMGNQLQLEVEESVHHAPEDCKVGENDLNLFCHVCRSWNHSANPDCRVAKQQEILNRPEVKSIMEGE